MGKPQSRFGYADDVALLAISPSLADNSAALSQDLQEALDWGTSEGITFDPNKSELLHFSRLRHSYPTNTLLVSAGPFTVSENQARSYLRWLGVLFDKKLTFKWHVKHQAAKALKVSKALSSLGNTARGVSPCLLRRAIVACVLPIAYYAAETWWPGRTRPGPSRPISNQVDSLLQVLSRVVLTSARAVLPVYRTTPTAALHRESGLPPPEISLNTQALAATVCLRQLDQGHPLHRRAKRVLTLARPTSRFARRVLALPQSESTDPLAHPPWTYIENREAASYRIGAPLGASKEQCARDLLTFLPRISPGDIVLYSDGSKLINGATGAGFVVYQASHEVLRQSIPLGSKAEVFDAEAIAALAGAETAIALPSARFATNLWVFLDNLEVAMRLLSPFPGTSQEIFSRFSEVTTKWQQRTRLPHVGPGEVRIRWVPGHTKVPGNEAADSAAKAGALLHLPEELQIHTIASLRRWAKLSLPQATNKLWKTVAPQSYQDLGINSAPSKPKELSLSRATLGRILASRTGHGDFADYHERFSHEDAHLYCRCGARKAPLHFFFCRIAKRRARRPPGPPSTTISELLGSYTGAVTLAGWLQKTQFYEDICPRAPPDP
jgi:ribonuclease HI